MRPTSKIATVSLVAIGCLLLPQPASAQNTQSLSDLYACETIAEAEAQLSCFRKETAKLRAAETAGDLVAMDPEEVEAFEDFKAEKEIKKLKEVKSRTLAIQSASQAGSGKMRFVLENGEVWVQVESERVKLGRGNPDTLTIRKKSFGSFLGQVNDRRPSFRVRRVE